VGEERGKGERLPPPPGGRATGLLMSDVDSLINERIGWVDDELRRYLGEATDPRQPPVHRMLRYHMGWTDAEGTELDPAEARRLGGKRLRGVLAVLACEACGGDGRAAVPVGAAVELVHNSSLIHDDIEDGDEERRHRPTLWRLWGVPQAVNAGAQMQALVPLELLRLRQLGIPDGVVLEVIEILSCAVLLLTTGQSDDLEFQDRQDVDARSYFSMSDMKTGALLWAAMDCGAVVAGAPLESRMRLRAFGKSFGLAFQVRDDYLGIWGDPAQTGKPVGSDIERGKRSLPVVLLLDGAADRDEVQHQLAERDVPAVMAAMERHDVCTEVEATVARLTAEALGHLEALGHMGDAGRALFTIARAALGREK
jgi:geranylgeranyl diphosphate synthase, type I